MAVSLFKCLEISFVQYILSMALFVLLYFWPYIYYFKKKYIFLLLFLMIMFCFFVLCLSHVSNPTDKCDESPEFSSVHQVVSTLSYFQKQVRTQCRCQGKIQCLYCDWKYVEQVESKTQQAEDKVKKVGQTLKNQQTDKRKWPCCTDHYTKWTRHRWSWWRWPTKGNQTKTGSKVRGVSKQNRKQWTQTAKT